MKKWSGVFMSASLLIVSLQASSAYAAADSSTATSPLPVTVVAENQSTAVQSSATQ